MLKRRTITLNEGEESRIGFFKIQVGSLQIQTLMSKEEKGQGGILIRNHNAQGKG